MRRKMGLYLGLTWVLVGGRPGRHGSAAGGDGMIRGLYSAAAGLLATQLQEGVVADNLANSGTAGYKARHVTFAAFGPMALDRVGSVAMAAGAAPIGTISSGAMIDQTAVNWTPGPLRATDNPMAAAISGPGMFAVQTAQGIRYTRAGEFRIDGAGLVVNPAGASVLAANGHALRVPSSLAGFTGAIQADGTVRVHGQAVGVVGVFAPPQARLTPVGGSLFALPAGAPAPAAVAATLRPGYVEQANVDVVAQMAALLQVQEAYASDQRAVQIANHTMKTALTDVGSLP